MLECILCLLLNDRAAWAQHLLTAPTDYGSIAYEYEKNSYPFALADVWANNAEAESALAFLQQEDTQAPQTLGIDLYSGFVLKGQMRKYFEFGEHLEPSYRDRMVQAMDWLTRTDPLDRQTNPPRKFWQDSQDDCTTLVDCRNTDNLRAMRETSVYLMAEATGNEATRQQYGLALERYGSTLLDIGMGEWDSPTYHGHTTAAYLNLVDFAQADDVRQLAQSALDWLFFSAALKYWRGTWTVPAKRMGGEGAEKFFWLYFGGAAAPGEVEKDWIHALATDYAPPERVMRLARREMTLPVEVRRTHPHYENWKPGLYGPAFYETLYLGETFQLGSLARGTAGDWQGFGLFVARGAGTDGLQVAGGGTHAIAHHRNLILWQGEALPQVTFPTGHQAVRQGVTFIATAQTWLAFWPLEAGFALEVGEALTHGSFEQFQAGVLARSRLSHLADRWEYRGSQGHTVGLRPQPGAMPQVWRDGILHDWRQHTDMDALLEDIGALSAADGVIWPSLSQRPLRLRQPNEPSQSPAPVLEILGLPFQPWLAAESSGGDRDSGPR